MKTISHKGYQASVEFEDGLLFIRVLHLNDVLVGECSAASEVIPTLARMVDDYLETCRKVGKEPEQPFKGSFNVRISPEIHRAAAHAAAQSGQSLNAWIGKTLAEKLGN